MFRGKRGLGLEFVGRVEEAIQIIAENPTLYARLIEDARRVLVKQFPFALWYVVADNGSVVIGCLHGKRDSSVEKAFPSSTSWQNSGHLYV